MTFTQAVHREWREQAERTISQWLDARVPSSSGALGLAAWLRACAASAWQRQRTVGAVARRAFGRGSYSAPAVTARFARAGLVSPVRYILAARVATVGALLGHGADIASVLYLLRLSQSSQLYRLIGTVEHHVRPVADLTTAMRANPAWAAQQYLGPLTPPRHRRVWEARLAPSAARGTTLSGG